MKKWSFLIPLSVLLVALTAHTQAALITATNSNGGVADGSTITRSVDITDSGEITDVNISVSWSKCSADVSNSFFCLGDEDSSFPDEASMSLTGPTGANSVLFPPSFFTLPLENIDVTTNFDDQADSPLLTTIQSGTFRPTGLLSIFNGLDVMGLWTLEISDSFNLDPTVFRSFTLNIITADDNGGEPGPGPSPVPEPGTLALLGLGLAGIGLARRRRSI